jgi:hypothetical protein
MTNKKSKGKGNGRFSFDSVGGLFGDDSQKDKGDSGEDKNAGVLRLRALRSAQDDRSFV